MIAAVALSIHEKEKVSTHVPFISSDFSIVL